MLKRRSYTLPLLLGMTVLLYVLLHDLFGGTLFSSSAYKSYSLQAMAWRNGQVGLGQDYPWLELAVYKGDWFVSFPPVPSVLLLPLTLFSGVNTPDNIVILCYCLVCLTAAYLAVRRQGGEPLTAAFWAVFLILGSNLLWICSDGSVWFYAQALNMAFCLLAILLAVRGNRVLSLGCVALAVGCRPFSILLFIPLLVYSVYEDVRVRELPLKQALLSQWRVLILPACIGLCYMWYNCVRFDNPLEFGHTYLPEFNRGEPQFSFEFVWRNLKNLVRPVTVTKAGGLSYPVFDGFLPFVANPFFIVLCTKLKKLNVWQWTALGCLLLNFLFLLMHRTLGGWQFGARYTVDLLSYAFLICLPSLKDRPRQWQIWLCVFAVLFNLYGALAMHFSHGG